MPHRNDYLKKELRINPVGEALSIAVTVFMSILICGYIVYYFTLESLKEEIHQGILRDAYTISTLVDVDAHKKFNAETSPNDPEYIKAIEPLKRVLATDNQLTYIYTCVLKDGKIYFVLNASPIYRDKDGDGIPEPTPELMVPYDDANPAIIRSLHDKVPAVTEELYTDKWGTFLSAYVPFYDSKKEFIGVLGVDIEVSEYKGRLDKVTNILILEGVIGFALASLIGIVFGLLRKNAADANRNRNLLINDLLEATRVAEESVKLKSEFLANISHELRTPMHSILSFSKFGQQDIEELQGSDFKMHHLGADIKEHFDSIQTSGKRLLSLINNLLDLSKFEAGKVVLSKSDYNFVEILNEVDVQLKPLLLKKELSLNVATYKKDISVFVDKDKITQVLFNLLSNAIKFSDEKSEIKVKVEKAKIVGDSGDTVDAIKVKVIDGGIGIPAGEEEKVFDKFVQSSKTKSGAGGTGLGLAICLEIVNLHGGKIWAENNKTKGAAFIFIIPVKGKANDVADNSNSEVESNVK